MKPIQTLSILALACLPACKQKSYPLLPREAAAEQSAPAAEKSSEKAEEKAEPAAPAPEKEAAAAVKSELDLTGLTPIPADFPLPSPHLLPVTRKIHSLLKDDLPAEATAMKAYEESVPAINDSTFQMVPIPGGTLTIGSPEGEAERGEDEKQVKNLEIKPFWMASTETTWGLYQVFMQSQLARNKDGSINKDGDIYSSEDPELEGQKLPDVVTQPTPPYMAMHFEMGEGGYNPEYPAISMTQHAASKFCEWLTAHTGHYYRLPTEAEWEFACRAGTTTAYSFGDDPAQLGDYGWFEDNSDFNYHPVGAKKPNPWGLYDMHGNVTEWCLDFYLPDRAGVSEGSLNPLPVSKNRYPRVTKGGHWDTSAADARSAARIPSNPGWKVTDPQIPKSLWYHTDAPYIGFRVVRPLAKPSVEEMHLLWNLGPGELE
ncbi:MAG: formylglycine-generating enzyme family protein [Verrucomicrobiales bacterium]